MKNKQKQLSVSLVIPNYNGKDLLEKNLPSIIKASQNPKNCIKEIIVVDDASTDDSIAYIESLNTKIIRLIKNIKNLGFSAGVNAGVGKARGSLICLLNNDVLVSENFLVSVAPLFVKKSVFGISLHEKGYGFAKGAFKDGFIVHEPGEEKETISPTFWVSGGSAVFRKSIWDKLGGMDAKLLSPYYWEDIDLSYRALKRGYVLFWDPKAIVVHEHESTIRKIDKKELDLIRERNQLIFIWKNLTSSTMFKKHIFGIFKRSVLHPGYFKVVLLALLKFPEVLEARKKEAKESTISDEAIFARFTQ